MSDAYLRVASRTVGLYPVDGLYQVSLVLSNRTLTPIGTGEGSTGDFPHQSSPPSYVQRVSRGDGVISGYLGPVTAGHLLTLFVTGRVSAGGPPSGTGTWTHAVGVRVANEFGAAVTYGDLYYKTADGTESPASNVSGTAFDFIEWADGVTFGDFVSQTMQPPGAAVTCGGTITPTEPHAYVVGCAAIAQFGTNTDYTMTPAGDVIEVVGMIYNNSGDNPSLWVADAPDRSGATTVSGTLDDAALGSPHLNWAGITFWVSADASTNPPAPGQWVYNETPTPAPDGATQTFSTLFPFADGSLRVKVSGTLQTFTSYDGAAGTFTVPFTPHVGEQLTVDYQAR